MRFSVLLLCVLLLPASASAASSDTFWDPFRNTGTNIETQLTSLLAALLDRLENIVEEPLASITQYKVPNPKWIGFQPFSSYLSPTGIRGDETPVLDESGAGTPCGGAAEDPFWANDCSCRCSEGGRSELTYEVSDRCPEDDNRTCQDCRPITRHDNSVTTVLGCREHF